MTISVNGRVTEVPADTTVEALLAGLDVPAGGRGVAVAVDAAVVPRADWPTFTVRDGARVEVLTAVQGG